MGFCDFPMQPMAGLCFQRSRETQNAQTGELVPLKWLPKDAMVSDLCYVHEGEAEILVPNTLGEVGTRPLLINWIRKKFNK